MPAMTPCSDTLQYWVFMPAMTPCSDTLQYWVFMPAMLFCSDTYSSDSILSQLSYSVAALVSICPAL